MSRRGPTPPNPIGRPRSPRPLRRKSRPRLKLAPASSFTALTRFRKDPTTRGLDCAKACICMPVGELAAIDDAADSVHMARSHFLREAARQFIERLRCEANDSKSPATGFGATSAASTSRPARRT